jgi:hypothetical protein
MVQGKEDQKDILLGHASRRDELMIVHHEVAMGQQNSLWKARRAAGVRQRQQIVRAHIHGWYTHGRKVPDKRPERQDIRMAWYVL